MGAIIEFICIADLEGAYIIFREGLEETVINLTNHPNQKIVDSASSILHAMNNMKNQEQQGKWHPPRHLQQHTQIQNPNLQNIPPSGGNGFRQGPMPNQQGAPAHMQSGGSPGYHPRNQPPPLQQQSPMHGNPGFEQCPIHQCMAQDHQDNLIRCQWGIETNQNQELDLIRCRILPLDPLLMLEWVDPLAMMTCR